jgi:hypothetical protein
VLALQSAASWGGFDTTATATMVAFNTRMAPFDNVR